MQSFSESPGLQIILHANVTLIFFSRGKSRWSLGSLLCKLCFLEVDNEVSDLVVTVMNYFLEGVEQLILVKEVLGVQSLLAQSNILHLHLGNLLGLSLHNLLQVNEKMG